MTFFPDLFQINLRTWLNFELLQNDTQFGFMIVNTIFTNSPDKISMRTFRSEFWWLHKIANKHIERYYSPLSTEHVRHSNLPSNEPNE